jgi:hypothetical protein
MVSGEVLALMLSSIMALADEGNRTVLSRLPPMQRAGLLMALLALVLFAIALVALIALGARWYRRTNPSTTKNEPGKREDLWASKPLKGEDSGDDYDDDADNDSTGDHTS